MFRPSPPGSAPRPRFAVLALCAVALWLAAGWPVRDAPAQTVVPQAVVPQGDRAAEDAERSARLDALGALDRLAGHADPGPGAGEAASAWAEAPESAVRLIAGRTASGVEETISLGLQFRLAPGWKIYWRSPGDAGMPPQLDWSGSTNLAGVEIAWPAPERFTALGFETAGYSGDVVLPITARLHLAGAETTLRTRVDYLVCDVICIPREAALGLALPQGPADASPHATAIAAARHTVPVTGGANGLALEAAAIDEGAVPRLRVRVRSDLPLAAPDLFVEGPQGFAFGAPLQTMEEGGTVLSVPAQFIGPRSTAWSAADLVGRPLTLTLVDGGRAIEAVLVAEAAPRPAGAWVALATMLATAVLGGLLLNLMPCVLPVLSLKLLGVAQLGGTSRGMVRRSLLATSAGILLSFLVLAGGAVALRQAGVAIGWGMQFQQPVFIVGMAAILLLFAGNLWGLFSVNLPGGLGERAITVTDRRRGPARDLLTGAFAALLATPCSAPFLGTAVGFALSRGPGEIVAVFAALGLGLALPYLAVAAAPGLARRLPRPGPWMIWLRRVLGLALAGTAAWLLLVLAAQAGAAAAAAVAGLLIAALAWLALSRRFGPDVSGVVRAGGVGLAVLLALGLPSLLEPPPGTAVVDRRWEPFDRAAITDHVASGRVVLVDVTADWCLTCQANKLAVLDRGPVAAQLADPSVVPMQVDWTRPDSAIAAFLASYGRYGIPFNVVYGPAAPQGLPLPELLSESAVLGALDAAAGNPGASGGGSGAPAKTPQALGVNFSGQGRM